MQQQYSGMQPPFWPPMNSFQMNPGTPTSGSSTENSPPAFGDIFRETPSPLGTSPIVVDEAPPPPKRMRFNDDRPRPKGRTVKPRLNRRAVELMRETLRVNPFPDIAERERLAREGGISAQQVYTWFNHNRYKVGAGD